MNNFLPIPYSILILFFTTTICLGQAPINDDCADALVMQDGVVYLGTTLDATHEVNYSFFECEIQDENDVWYRIDVDDNALGYEIIFNKDEQFTRMYMEVYRANELCQLVKYENGYNCIEYTDIFRVKLNCETYVPYIYIKVASLNILGSIEFTIQSQKIVSSTGNVCDDATFLGYTSSDPTFSNIQPICASGTLAYGCPNTIQGVDCGFSTLPTVWYHIQSDDISSQLFTTVSANGDWSPVWSVFQGPDCNNLQQIGGGPANIPFCSNQGNNPGLHQVPLNNGIYDYWIAITSEQVIPYWTDPSFEICAYSTINAVSCVGDLSAGCGNDPSFNLEVVDRSFGGSPNGPFCSGETVTVNMKFTYDASKVGADWLIGLVPTFGKGWDVEAIDFNSNAPGGALWYEADSPCAPYIAENVPHLAVYYDEFGRLQLCNSLCENCFQHVGNQIGMKAGDPLPSGWFWVTIGSNSGCLNDCSPNEGWGIGSAISVIDFNMVLKIKDFANIADLNNNKDLQISFQTFSDGVAGCWEDPVGECLIDYKLIGPAWEVSDSCTILKNEFLNISTIYDADCNAATKTDQIPFPDLWLLDTISGDHYYSNSGNYHLNFGDKVIALKVDSIMGYDSYPPILNIDMDTIGYYNDSYSFMLCSNGLFPDPSHHSAHIGEFRRGFNSRLMFYVKNQSQDTQDFTLNADVKDLIKYCNTYYNGSTLSEDTLKIDIHLAPFQADTFIIQLFTYLDAPLGQNFEINSWIDPTEDINELNNYSTIFGTITASFDPNDKVANVSRNYLPNYRLDGTQTYTIRFQNTGNIDADFVRIVDVIEEGFDLSSVKMLAASHDYRLRTKGDTLEWYFENINLVDSLTDFEKSQGYVSFIIKPKASHITNKTVLRNKAEIYFDYNEAVLTDEAVVTFYDCHESMYLRNDQDLSYFKNEFPLCDVFYGDIHLANLEGHGMLDGLKQISELAGDLYIENCADLENLQGLEHIQKISGKIVISNNSKLSDISVLNNIAIQAKSIVIQDNPLLSDCSVDVVCDGLVNGGIDVVLSGNIGPCLNNPSQKAKCCAYSETIINMVCEGESVDWYGSTINDPGTYHGVFVNESGCEVASEMILNVKQNSKHVIDVTICDGESYVTPLGEYSVSGTYEEHYMASNECDSILTIHVGMATPANIIIHQTMDTLYLSSSPSALYFIVDCESLDTIQLGSNHYQLMDAQNLKIGVLSERCYTWTDCIYYQPTAVHTVGKETKISVQPNPFLDELVIRSSDFQGSEVGIEINDNNGKNLLSETYYGVTNELVLPLENAVSGVYFIQIRVKGSTTVFRLMKI